MIKYLFVNNYKSFVNFRINFDRLNLLIGRNGIGKSNVFTLIAAIRNLIQGQNQALTKGFPLSTCTRWMKSDIQTFEMGLSDGVHEYIYGLEIKQNDEKQLTIVFSEKVECDGNVLYRMSGNGAVMYDDSYAGTTVLSDPGLSGISYIPQDGLHERLRTFRLLIDRIILCVPNPKIMQDTVANDVYMPFVDFSNIASTFNGLMVVDPDIYISLSQKMHEIDPAFKKVRIEVGAFTKNLVFDYMYNDVLASYRFNELSDGERMLFALYMLLYCFIKKGYTVLLDEPDNYLSLKEIQPWCMDVEGEIMDSGQCLLISHHPEIIDYLADTRGIWMSRLNSGESKIGELPEVGDNIELLTYSQMIARGILDDAE